MVNMLMRLYAGLDRAYGQFTIKTNDGPKAKGRGITKRGEVTKTLWQSHLNGINCLGIVPIRDDGTCNFAAIDVDIYVNFDPAELASRIKELNWPFVVCRSKSGGAHIYAFFSDPIPAKIVRSKMREVAVKLGYPRAEVFPKQDTLESHDDCGNWINMPYFDSEKTTRYAIKDGFALGCKEFIEYAVESSMTKDDLAYLEMPDNEFEDAPPCLERLVEEGFPKGSMNNALFNMGVYARMKYPDDWQRKIYDYNERFMGPGTPQEVQQIIKSLDKKKYIYKCNDEPLCSKCNKLECSQREYGVASSNSPYKSTTSQKQYRPCILDEVTNNVLCYLPPEGSDDEPYWVFTFAGKQMDVSIDMIQSQQKYLREFLRVFRKVVLPIDENRWMVAINNLLDSAEEHEMAIDAGPEGHLMIHLRNFCCGRVQAKTKDEILLGKPWKDSEGSEGEANRVYFRSPDFLKYLDQQRFKVFKEREIYQRFRRKGMTHHKFNIKKSCVACWSVNPFDEVTELFEAADTGETEY